MARACPVSAVLATHAATTSGVVDPPGAVDWEPSRSGNQASIRSSSEGMSVISRSRVRSKWSVFLAFVIAALVMLPTGANAQSDLYNGMRWRLIGPFRAGRVSAVVGIPTIEASCWPSRRPCRVAHSTRVAAPQHAL